MHIRLITNDVKTFINSQISFKSKAMDLLIAAILKHKRFIICRVIEVKSQSTIVEIVGYREPQTFSPAGNLNVHAHQFAIPNIIEKGGSWTYSDQNSPVTVSGIQLNLSFANFFDMGEFLLSKTQGGLPLLEGIDDVDEDSTPTMAVIIPQIGDYVTVRLNLTPNGEHQHFWFTENYLLEE